MLEKKEHDFNDPNERDSLKLEEKDFNEKKESVNDNKTE